MKAESRQIPQKLAARLKFVCCKIFRLQSIPGSVGRTDEILDVGTSTRIGQVKTRCIFYNQQLVQRNSLAHRNELA